MFKSNAHPSFTLCLAEWLFEFPIMFTSSVYLNFALCLLRGFEVTKISRAAAFVNIDDTVGGNIGCPVMLHLM